MIKIEKAYVIQRENGKLVGLYSILYQSKRAEKYRQKKYGNSFKWF